MNMSKCFPTEFQILCFAALLLPGLVIPHTFGQENIIAQQQDNSGSHPDKTFTIRVAVEEVRLDAVVLDKKGHPVNDLTADDFEIYQDDVPQKIVSSIYLTNQTDSPVKPTPSVKKSPNVAPIPTPALEKDKVRRVLIFIVDDISMGGSIEFLKYSKMALKRFVEKQMQSGDLVAILRTSYGNSALQMFLSDKKQLLARIDSIRWGSNAGFEVTDENRYNVFDSQLSALRYSIQALKHLPGRKALLMLSAQTTIPNPANVFSPFTPDFYYRYIKSYNRLADQALRAGVVVHLLDIRGLEGPFSSTYSSLSDRYADGANPLPAKTGGMFLQNSNFFVDGIGEAENMLKGYYLLSYTPPATTFKDNRKNIYHRTKIKVKRRGTTIYTRDGFYGLSEPDEESTMAQNPLGEAIFSPFKHNDLSVNLASGYLDDPKAGYVLRSWLHLGTKNITILKKKDEGYFVSLQTLTITSNIDGYIQDSSMLEYDFRIKEENLSWIKEHGIRFSLLLPVKRPGSYYIRVAVKDQESGKVGSAYQYVEIPDLKKNRLALSDIFVINRSEDVAWILSGQTKDFSQIAISPVLQRDESRSPALRSYLPGDHFQYMSVLYNAKTKKEMTPDLESQFVLYKDGSELFKSEAQPLTINNSGNFTRIPIMKRLLLGDALQEGDYVLQLLVNDKQRKGKDGSASKTMNFSITPQ